MSAKARNVDALRSWDRAEYEDAWQGVEAWVSKNGVQIDAMNEIRRYIDNIVEATFDARQDIELEPFIEEPKNAYEHAPGQISGFASLVNVGLISSLLVAEHLKSKWKK